MLTHTAVCSNNIVGILVINVHEKILKAARCSRKQMVAIRAATFAQWVQVSPAPEFGLDPPPPHPPATQTQEGFLSPVLAASRSPMMI